MAVSRVARRRGARGRGGAAVPGGKRKISLSFSAEKNRPLTLETPNRFRQKTVITRDGITKTSGAQRRSRHDVRETRGHESRPTHQRARRLRWGTPSTWDPKHADAQRRKSAVLSFDVHERERAQAPAKMASTRAAPSRRCPQARRSSAAGDEATASGVLAETVGKGWNRSAAIAH